MTRHHSRDRDLIPPQTYTGVTPTTCPLPTRLSPSSQPGPEGRTRSPRSQGPKSPRRVGRKDLCLNLDVGGIEGCAVRTGVRYVSHDKRLQTRLLRRYHLLPVDRAVAPTPNPHLEPISMDVWTPPPLRVRVPTECLKGRVFS